MSLAPGVLPSTLVKVVVFGGGGDPFETLRLSFCSVTSSRSFSRGSLVCVCVSLVVCWVSPSSPVVSPCLSPSKKPANGAAAPGAVSK